MTATSSYIFLKNPHFVNNKKSKKDTNPMDVELPIDSVYHRFQDLFSLDKNNNVSDSIYKHTYSIIADDITETFVINEAGEGTYIQITVSGKTRASVINSLEDIEQKIYSSNIEQKYIVIVSYDAISEYYCNKIYPKLNELERNLRKLMFNTYTLQFGTEYYSKTITEKIQNKGKRFLNQYENKQGKTTETIKSFFYSLGYSDIKSILFDEQWTVEDQKEKEQFLSKHPNLNELSNEQLKNAFDRFTPKSDWQRFFDEKVKRSESEISATINNIQNNRNNVAHCKFFKKDDYIKSRSEIRKLNLEIMAAIEMTEAEDFFKKNYENLMLGVQRIKDIIVVFKESIAPALQAASKSMFVVLNAASEHFNEIEKSNLATGKLFTSLAEIKEPSLNHDNPNCDK